METLTATRTKQLTDEDIRAMAESAYDDLMRGACLPVAPEAWDAKTVDLLAFDASGMELWLECHFEAVPGDHSFGHEFGVYQDIRNEWQMVDARIIDKNPPRFNAKEFVGRFNTYGIN